MACGPAMAQDSASPLLPTTHDGKPVKEKKICRSDTETGSMIVNKTCHTKLEWQAIDAKTQYGTDRYGLSMTGPQAAATFNTRNH